MDTDMPSVLKDHLEKLIGGYGYSNILEMLAIIHNEQFKDNVYFEYNPDTGTYSIHDVDKLDASTTRDQC